LKQALKKTPTKSNRQKQTNEQFTEKEGKKAAVVVI